MTIVSAHRQLFLHLSMSRWTIFSLLLCCSISASSQTFLYLKKLGGRQSVTYHPGDQIRFQLKGDAHFTSGTIESFGEDHLMIHETEIKLSDIERYDIRGISTNNFNYKVSSNTLFFAGGLLPLAELANQQVSGSGNDTGIHDSIWIASGILVAGGFILRWLEPKYFKPGLKRKATIITRG